MNDGANVACSGCMAKTPVEDMIRRNAKLYCKECWVEGRAGKGKAKDPVSDELITVSLNFAQWSEVCAALSGYVKKCTKKQKVSASEATIVLQEIDRVMRGEDEVAPADDVL